MGTMTNLMLVLGVTWYFFWEPIRSTVNQWRLHRRQKRYPHVVFYSTNNGHTPRSKGLLGLVVALVLVPLNGLAWLVASFLSSESDENRTQQALDVAVPPVEAPKPAISTRVNKKTATMPAPSTPPSIVDSKTKTADEDKPPTPVDQIRPKLLPRPSSLRKPRASSNAMSSSSLSSRVGFAEQSNGSVKTEKRYYNPADTPGQTARKHQREAARAATATTNETLNGTSHRLFQRAPTSPARSRPAPPPQSEFVLHGQSPLGQLRVSQPNQGSTNPQASRGSRSIVWRGPPTRPVAPISQEPLSAQIRKRRQDGDDSLSLLEQKPVKRANLGSRPGSRIRLGSSFRVVQTRMTNKRLRDQREGRILKEMNQKRVKKVQEEKKPVKPTETAAPSPASNTTFQFGSGGDSSKAAAPPPKFGGSVTTPAPAPAPTTFNFGGSAPTPAASNSDAQAPAPPFVFGGSAPAPSGSDGGAPAATPVPAPATGGVSFGATTLGDPKAPGAPAPVPVPTFGASNGAAPATAPSAGFSGSVPAAGNTKDAAPAPIPTFGGGGANSTPAAPAPTPQFGNTGQTAPAPSTSAPASTPSVPFGSTNGTAPVPAASAPVPSFPFGGAPAPATAAPVPAPSIPFGGAPVPAANSTPSLQFGSTAAAGGAAPKIQFGASTSAAPTFSAGSSAAPVFGQMAPTAAPGVPAFGQVPVPPAGGGGFATGGSTSGASARRRAKARSGRAGRR